MSRPRSSTVSTPSSTPSPSSSREPRRPPSRPARARTSGRRERTSPIWPVTTPSSSSAFGGCSRRIARLWVATAPRTIPTGPTWAALPLDEILERLRTLRAELVALVRRLTPQECARTGTPSDLRRARRGRVAGVLPAPRGPPPLHRPGARGRGRPAAGLGRRRRDRVTLSASCAPRAPRPPGPEGGAAAAGTRRGRSSPGGSARHRRRASSTSRRRPRSHGPARPRRPD